MKDTWAKTDGLWPREAVGVTQIKSGGEGGEKKVVSFSTLWRVKKECGCVIVT